MILPAQCGDGRVERRLFLQDGEFLFGALRLVVAQQSQYQAVAVRDGIAEFLFAQSGIEEGDGFLRRSSAWR